MGHIYKLFGLGPQSQTPLEHPSTCHILCFRVPGFPNQGTKLSKQTALADHVNFSGDLFLLTESVPQLSYSSLYGMVGASLKVTRKALWFSLLSLIVCSCPSPSYYAPARSQCNLAITSHFRCPCSDYSLISFKHLDYCPWRVNPSPRMFFPVNKELCSNGPQLTLESVCTTHHLGWHPPVLQAMSKTAPRLFFNPCFLGPNLAPLC